MVFVREAKGQDYEVISSLIRNELGYPELRANEIKKNLEIISNDSNFITYVALDEDCVVGFIGVMKGFAYNEEGHYAQIMALSVSLNHQRQGIGRALVKTAQQWVAAQGISHLYVSSNERRKDAHAFYESLGFSLEKKSYMFAKNIEEA